MFLMKLKKITKDIKFMKNTLSKLQSEAKFKIINIIGKLDNGSHSSNQLQGVDEALTELFSDQIQKAVEETRKEEKGNLEQCMVYLFRKLSEQKTIRMSQRTLNWLWGSMCSWVDEYIKKLSIQSKGKMK